MRVHAASSDRRSFVGKKFGKIGRMSTRGGACRLSHEPRYQRADHSIVGQCVIESIVQKTSRFLPLFRNKTYSLRSRRLVVPDSRSYVSTRSRSVTGFERIPRPLCRPSSNEVEPYLGSFCSRFAPISAKRCFRRFTSIFSVLNSAPEFSKSLVPIWLAWRFCT